MKKSCAKANATKRVQNVKVEDSTELKQRNKQKGIKNDVKNDVKNGYREHPGKENLEKWSKNAFFPEIPSRHTSTAKKMKNDHFRVHFCNSKVRVPFFTHFSFILSFNFEKKWKQNEMENE